MSRAKFYVAAELLAGNLLLAKRGKIVGAAWDAVNTRVGFIFESDDFAHLPSDGEMPEVCPLHSMVDGHPEFSGWRTTLGNVIK